jgi:hypothetical protein
MIEAISLLANVTPLPTSIDQAWARMPSRA